MKTIILERAGDIENFMVTDMKRPDIKENEVLVKVKSIGINPVDVKARAYDGVLEWIFGKERPVILGWDIAGEVVKVGQEVTAFSLGNKVFGMINFFGKGQAYAEYVACPAAHLAVKPENIDHQQAAASAMVASTAYQALVDVAHVKKGDKVLVHAASGGVGHMAVQLAKHFEAYVIGTSSAKNKDFVLAMGCDEHLDYTREHLTERVADCDVVIDTIQGDTLMQSIDIVKPGGIIVTLPSPEIGQDIKTYADQRNVNIEFMMVTSKQGTIRAIADLMAKGALQPHIHRTFSFDDMGKAHLEVETNRVVGKVVVNI